MSDKAKDKTLDALDKKIFAPLLDKIRTAVDAAIANGDCMTGISYNTGSRHLEIEDFHASPLFHEERTRYLAEEGIKLEIIYVMKNSILIRASW